MNDTDLLDHKVFTWEELCDIHNTCVERGIPFSQLVHDAVMNDLAR